ncbi:hypothetical protein AMST5_01631 [freshwater sediment metagenome]|uniref:Uncharacterized protein n=1 Tax=freshwater sediment metagenome TaxID=556182 RepID=A0AA48M305_9ZZZZ
MHVPSGRCDRAMGSSDCRYAYSDYATPCSTWRPACELQVAAMILYVLPLRERRQHAPQDPVLQHVMMHKRRCGVQERKDDQRVREKLVDLL